MRVLVLLVLVLGVALAKPYENLEDFLNDYEVEMDMGATNTPMPDFSSKPSSEHPTKPDHGTDHPTMPSSEHPTQPEHSTDHPTGEPKKELWEKFLYFLKKTVHGVKPDEHPDVKYEKPGKELIAKLLVLKKHVVETVMGPIMDIIKLLKHDGEEMWKRVHLAVHKQDMAEAKHVVGEFFIAINRRFAGLIIEADNQGLFDKLDDDKAKRVKRELDDHVKHAQHAVMYILKNFNQFRVNDGLLDAPFVRLGIRTAKIYFAAVHQTIKNAKVSEHVYTDMISDMVRLSLKEHNHAAAVQRAGAGVLSFIRRQTKVVVALHRMYGPKQCPAKRPGKGKPKIEDDEDDDEY